MPVSVHAQTEPAFHFDTPEGWEVKSDETGEYITPESADFEQDSDIRIYTESEPLDEVSKKTFQANGMAPFTAAYAKHYEMFAKGLQFGEPEIVADGVYPNLTSTGKGVGVGKRAGWKYLLELNFLVSNKKKAHLSNPGDFLGKSEGPVLSIVILASELAYKKYDDDISKIFDSLEFK